ncbi:cytochrome-c peroxidase [Sulfurimonas sp. C5]|uniref:cytochrome-c peroxidase n=1 Tax=Sulfurimonas sp. C5 TaxID=3036947 RepID=UPI002455AE35|nr:cytochrome-c peroxidase [Sulfurimonas sp. C5]MDH4943841.1 cytochrome-c peroxidase [Sulfurimonas sp. C5]
MNKFTLYLLFQTVLCAADLITPIPTTINVDEEKVALGKALFFDTKLSKDNTISCATCHQLDNGGVDHLAVSIGVNGQTGSRNAPTVYNAVFNFKQFWDGRAGTLQEQALGPIENPVEMAHNLDKLIMELNSSAYKSEFEAIYKEGVTKENIGDAIAEYEKTLITPNAPFDLYLKGNLNILTKEEKEGYELFKTKGCIACHQGINLGGNSYNKFGIYQDSNSTDLGRYNITHNERDKYYFKVPSLRNVEKTAPYFHDGRTKDLKEAVSIMSQYQLGRKITKDEINKIVLFLKSLNGELPAEDGLNK